MLFERPGGARDAVGKFHALPHFVHREMMPAHDPARLADPGQPVSPHPRLAECFRKFAAQEIHGAIRLLLAFDADARGFQRIERRFDVRHIDHGRRAAGETHRESVAADQARTARRDRGCAPTFLRGWASPRRRNSRSRSSASRRCVLRRARGIRVPPATPPPHRPSHRRIHSREPPHRHNASRTPERRSCVHPCERGGEPRPTAA